MPLSKITPCLWFDGKAEEAAKFYTSIFPDSRIDEVHRAASDNPSTEQDAVLTDMQANQVTGFTGGGSAQFFNLIRTHTIQGTFSDPFYGGNENFIGWDLIGYPGARTVVSANLQLMDRKP
jgi:hypothetical protein